MRIMRASSVASLLLVAGALPQSSLAFGGIPAPAARCHRACVRMASAGNLLRVSHSVADVAATAAFYEGFLGLSASAAADGAVTLSSAGEGMRLELVDVEGGGFQPNAGYRGLSARVPSVAEAVATATSCGGSVLREPEAVEHGPSQTPDEPEDALNTLTEALVADPSGYPLLLYEDDKAENAILSGVQLEVHEWKTTQEWWEELGWSTQRWNSNVHREGSLTVTVGAAPADPPIGPRGPPSPSIAPVVQLTYVYGCSPVRHATGGLRAIVLAATDGGAAELSDPEGYRFVLE